LSVNFRERLDHDCWQELVTIVKDRLTRKHGKRLVVDGLVFRAGGLVWWDRTPPPNLSHGEERWPMVLYHDGVTYLPDSFLHLVSYAQFGLPVGNWERWSCLKTRITDLQALAILYYDVQFPGSDLRRLTDITATGENWPEVERILKRVKMPDNVRATAAAECLSLGCTDLLAALDSARSPFNLDYIANLGFKVGEAYTDLQHLRDKRLLEQNKRGKSMSGAQTGIVRDIIADHVKRYIDKHQRAPTAAELLKSGAFEVETKNQKPKKALVGDTWIAIATFREHVANALVAMGVKRSRGRPRKV
jgi:hypothetical protein